MLVDRGFSSSKNYVAPASSKNFSPPPAWTHQARVRTTPLTRYRCLWSGIKSSEPAMVPME